RVALTLTFCAFCAGADGCVSAHATSKRVAIAGKKYFIIILLPPGLLVSLIISVWKQILF
ncbi:hypothetical protein MMA98_24055, partial [Salmonella enterica]|nr:hypothetical protein [Salmonella enterica]